MKNNNNSGMTNDNFDCDEFNFDKLIRADVINEGFEAKEIDREVLNRQLKVPFAINRLVEEAYHIPEMTREELSMEIGLI